MNLVDVAFGRGTVLALALAIAPWFAMTNAEPERGRVVVTDTETTILDVVEFAPGTSMLLTTSVPTLDAVAATLLGNPSIELVEVQSHTSGVGDATQNLALTGERADEVVAYLVAHGVPAARLEAQGYGDTQPIDRASPKKNERVSFLILKRTSDDVDPR